MRIKLLLAVSPSFMLTKQNYLSNYVTYHETSKDSILENDSSKSSTTVLNHSLTSMTYKTNNSLSKAEQYDMKLFKRAFWDDRSVSSRTGILLVITLSWMGLTASTGGSVQVASFILSALWSVALAISAHVDTTNSGSVSARGLKNTYTNYKPLLSNSHAVISTRIVDMYNLRNSTLVKREFNDELEETYELLDSYGLYGPVIDNLPPTSLKGDGKMLDVGLMWVYKNGSAVQIVTSKNNNLTSLIHKVGSAQVGIPNIGEQKRSNSFEVD